MHMELICMVFFHTAQHTFVAGEAWAGHAGTDTL